ncbi:hypothetical protein [uncultured Algoriphagus sp.]|uniref:hypothetical protein n=1 Tax=uncultured Algoriphagus sp. TaxID=417365 RepID=UPI0030ED1DAB
MMLLLAFGIFTQALYAQQPGGVSGANLWLKADDGTTNNGGNLTDWIDQAGINTFFIAGNPVFITDGINFNPAVSINNQNAASNQLPPNRIAGNTAINAVEAFAVYKDAVNAHGSLIGSTVSGNGNQTPGFFTGNNSSTGNVFVSDGSVFDLYQYSQGSTFHIAGFDVSSSPATARINASPTSIAFSQGNFSSVNITPLIGGGSKFSYFHLPAF